MKGTLDESFILMQNSYSTVKWSYIIFYNSLNIRLRHVINDATYSIAVLYNEPILIRFNSLTG